jgi:hypothetical protein
MRIVLVVPFLLMTDVGISADDRVFDFEETRAKIANSMYQSGAPLFKDRLTQEHLTKLEIDALLRKAFDEYALCVVDAIVQESERLDLSVPVLLTWISGGGVNSEDIEIVERYNSEAQSEIIQPCTDSVSEKYGIDVG